MDILTFEEMAQDICNEFEGTHDTYNTIGDIRTIEDPVSGFTYRIEGVYKISKQDRLEIVYDNEHDNKIYVRHLTDEQLFTKTLY